MLLGRAEVFISAYYADRYKTLRDILTGCRRGCEHPARHISRHACGSLLFAHPYGKMFLDDSTIRHLDQTPKYVSYNAISGQIHPVYIIYNNHLRNFVNYFLS